MTHTLTTDELRQIVETDHTQCGDAAAMARELLANREAQPVGYIGLPMLEQMRDGRQSGRIWSTPEDLGGSVPVFTAPPAPTVPDERAAFNAWNNEDNLPIAGVPAKNAAWLAWQARAMLAQPVSQGYKLPPHAYRELVNALRDTAVKYSGTDQLRDRLNTALSQFIEPDHPHTRPALQERN